MTEEEKIDMGVLWLCFTVDTPRDNVLKAFKRRFHTMPEMVVKSGRYWFAGPARFEEWHDG